MIERLFKEPTLILDAVRQFVLFAVLMKWIVVTNDQLAGGMMALSAVLMLVNRTLVVPTPDRPRWVRKGRFDDPAAPPAPDAPDPDQGWGQ